jgi:carbamate kinase
MAKIVVALGGNALGENPEEQLKLAEAVSVSLVDLVEAGNHLVLVHGNGPQVGQIRLSFESSNHQGVTPLVPFAECTAMSQGYIGYHLQQAIDKELVKRRPRCPPVIAMLTQVVVDEDDPAFQNPTKPIGGFFDEETAKRLSEETGQIYREDSGRGWRRVVPSPRPIDIYERDTLRTLFDTNHVVIACGGGGIPVVYRGREYVGVDAVIDKDFTAAKLAQLIDADVLLILTAIDHIFINYNTPEQQMLESIELKEAEEYIEQGHFAPGSMLPKVQAACEFVKAGVGKRAIIGSLEHALDALKGENGTTIYS